MMMTKVERAMDFFVVLATLVCFVLMATATPSFAGVEAPDMARDLTEEMTPYEYDGIYKPWRLAAEEASGEGNHVEAAKSYEEAAWRTAFTAIRAAMLRNAGFHMARAGECVKAREYWTAAERYLREANKLGTYAKSRAKTRADIEWGFEVSACKR